LWSITKKMHSSPPEIYRGLFLIFLCIRINIFRIISKISHWKFSIYKNISLIDWFDTGSHGLNHEELHIDNCKDFTWTSLSPGNTSFPIFHHERPIANLPFPTLPDGPMHPRSVLTFADISHQGKDWHGW
jgi:hypothetical protein